MSKRNLTPPQGFRSSNDVYYIMDLSNKTNVVNFYTPEAISEKPSQAQYQLSGTVGRGNQFVTYTHSDNRQLDATIVFVDDNHAESLLKIRDRLTAMQTPRYSGGQVIPNEVQVRFGSLVARGVLMNLSFNWSGPYRNGYQIVLSVQVTITETRKVPLGKSEVLSGKLSTEW